LSEESFEFFGFIKHAVGCDVVYSWSVQIIQYMKHNRRKDNEFGLTQIGVRSASQRQLSRDYAIGE
jgi:hypothetical protein